MMRSPVGELIRAIRPRALRNDAPVPYVGRGQRVGFSALFGGQQGAEAQMRAMGSVGTLFAIVNRTSTSTSAVKWHLWEKAPSGRDEDRTMVTSHAALDTWNRWNRFYSRQRGVEAGQQHVDLVGECRLVIVRDRRFNLPLEIWPVRPDRIEPIPHREKFLAGYIYHGPDGEDVPLDVGDVMGALMPNPLDPYRGMGPVQAILTDLDSAKYSAEWNRNFFANNADPGGVIESPQSLTDDEFDEFTERWREQHQGVSNAHRVALLENGMKWVDRKYTMRDMQFVELRKVSREVIREAFGMPKFAVGDVDDVNRATADASANWFAEQLTVPRLERWKEMINTQFLPLYGPTADGLEFDYESPARADRDAENAERESIANSVKTYIAAGFEPRSVAKALGAPNMEVDERPEPVRPPTPGRESDGGPDGPGDVEPGRDNASDLLLRSLPANAGSHHRLPPAPRATAESLDPGELPDVSHVLEALDKALVELMREWEDVTVGQRRQLVAEVRRIVESGDLGELANLQVDSTHASEILYTTMLALSGTAAGQVVSEAAGQGVTITATTPPAALLSGAATVVTATLAMEMAVSAARAAMAASGPGVTAEQVAERVQDYLDGLSTAGAQRQLGGALHGAMNAARMETLRAAPEASIYAVEKNDRNTCSPCKEIDGKFLGTSSQMNQIEKLYPAGAYGGYVYCLGGPNCRGTVVAVWR